MLIPLIYVSYKVIKIINGHVKAWYIILGVYVLFIIIRTIDAFDRLFTITDIEVTEMGALISPIIWFGLIMLAKKTIDTFNSLGKDVTELKKENADIRLLNTENLIKEAEGVRIIAEDARKQAEEARKIAEEARVLAETVREEIFKKLRNAFSKI